MIEFKSKRGSQVVRVQKTSAGVSISTREKVIGVLGVHIFDECLDELILALLKCKKEIRLSKERTSEEKEVTP